MFTGDSSGDWVAKVLYDHKFATKSTSKNLNDDFKLINTYISAAVRCAPPNNKPLRDEFDNCLPYLQDEISFLNNLQVIICLGKIAFDSYCKLMKIKGAKFSHGKLFHHNNLSIICSYHPSRQNTQTGRLTWLQWKKVFTQAMKILND